MTREELDEQIEQAVVGFSSLEGVESELAEKLVGEGFLSYDDLSVIEPDALIEMGGLTAEQVDKIVAQAEVKAAEAEKAAAEQRRKQREQDRLEAGRGGRRRREEIGEADDGAPSRPRPPARRTCADGPPARGTGPPLRREADLRPTTLRPASGLADGLAGGRWQRRGRRPRGRCHIEVATTRRPV